jgi:hypothetical protein
MKDLLSSFYYLQHNKPNLVKYVWQSKLSKQNKCYCIYLSFMLWAAEGSKCLRMRTVFHTSQIPGSTVSVFHVVAANYIRVQISEILYQLFG